MNVKTALDRARNLNPGQKAAAANLYADIDYELEFGGIDNQDDYEQAEDALSYLEEHFPGVRQQSTDRVAGGRHTPNLSRKASAAVYTPAADHATPTHTATAVLDKPSDQPKPDAGATSGTATRSVPAPAQKRVASRRARYQARRTPRFAPSRRTVVQLDQATGSWGSFAWTTTLTAFGLCFLYLVLTPGKGSVGLGKLFTGATTAMTWVINPTVDPLRPSTTSGATS